jgi:NAD(P)-dependent dehydrogenase (short-subunit alcohol dehydrogenase family)
MNIEGRTALVTGGARRVGRVLALGLARAGADVVIDYRKSDDAARDTVREIESLGRRAIAVQADVSDSGDVERLVATAAREMGKVDILVNSASIFERKNVLEITESDWDRVMSVNLKGPFLLSQSFARHMRTAQDASGVIINIVDLSALQPWAAYAHHAVSKAGLLHLTKVLARALGPSIRVNAIAPGTVLPPDDYNGQDSGGGPERRVLERSGTPEDVLDALLYLVRSDFVTGDVLIVDGGRALL